VTNGFADEPSLDVLGDLVEVAVVHAFLVGVNRKPNSQ
jgi:hypothetical protein